MLRPENMDQQEEERREKVMVKMVSGNSSNLIKTFRELHQQQQANAKILALNALQQIRDGPSAYILSAKLFKVPAEMKEMMLRMSCRVCNRFPSPDRRFICSAGHLLCLACGADRGKKLEFKCLVQYDVGEGDTDRINGTNGSTICQNTLAAYHCDPVYTAFWHHAIWQCPNKNKGCNISPIKGINFYIHKCSLPKGVKKTKVGAEKTTHIQVPKEQIDMVSGSTNNLTERFGERQQEELAKAKIMALGALEKIRGGPSAYILSTKVCDVPAEMKEMMLRMSCRVCNRFPPPDKRHICSAGHLLCLTCGESRGKELEFKCLADGIKGINGQPMPKCQNVLAVYPCDPVYTTFWHHAIWQCPNKNRGCKNSPIKGINFYNHKCSF